MFENDVTKEIDRLRVENADLLKKLERSNNAWLREREENIKLRARAKKGKG
jgi:hypothetical protein